MFTYKKHSLVASITLLAGLFVTTATTANTVGHSTNVTLTRPGNVRMKIYGRALPPIGFVSFCANHRSECTKVNKRAVRAKMTTDRWLQLVDINADVNIEIRPVTDYAKFKVLEYWTYPVNSGDCEDYVLLKKRRLVELGWPPSSLLITVVRDRNGDGHAVLTASTDVGDFVLDNQSEKVKLWQRTPYTYIKRQSLNHPYVWVTLNDRNRTRRASTSSHKKQTR